MKKIRFVAICAGLATDIIGTLVFSSVIAVGAVVFHVRNGEAPGTLTQKLMSDVPFLLVLYAVGIAFTFVGAWVTAKMSEPHSVMNTLVLGLISTFMALVFAAKNPVWHTILSLVTILPVSLIPGYWLGRKSLQAAAEADEAMPGF